MKYTPEILGVAVGLLLTFRPITAPVHAQPPNTTPQYVYGKRWNPAQTPIDVQNKKIEQKKAEEARIAAEKAAVEAARVQAEQVAAAKEKEAQKASNSAALSSVTRTPQSYPQPDNFYKSFIYQKESGNNPLSRNAGGCLGLGQACPGSKLLAVCPTLSYDCEDRFFTKYALDRYGSWQNAYNFWLSHRWW